MEEPTAKDSDSQASRSRIHILRDAVARKIAAGEVIDRPYSVVRELMDNALDAGASNIDVYLEQGGLRSIRVVDDGSGMSREDLEVCWQPHATSKIETETDLEQVQSLGFRGEALSSMAAVSRMEIFSTPQDAELGHRVRVEAGKQQSIEATRGRPGTGVEVRDLFYTLPARKRFFKRPAGETAMGRTVFIEKALPFPDRSFRLFTDGQLKQFLPAAPPTERVATAFSTQLHPDFLHEISGSGEGFSFTVILGGPELARRDRKLIQIFVNNRRVWEYSLVQAVEYAFSEVLPGGSFPVAFVFLEMQPELVDFNVHPAKKEARFKHLGTVHHRLVTVTREFLRAYEIRAASAAPSSTAPSSAGPAASQESYLAFDGATDAAQARASEHPSARGGDRRREGREVTRRHAQGDTRFDLGTAFRPAGTRGSAGTAGAAGAGRGGNSDVAGSTFGDQTDQTNQTDQADQTGPAGEPGESSTEAIHYIGQLFGVFLLAEYRGGFYIVDQHAGHERVLFDRLRAGARKQTLLVPEEFEVDDDQEAVLQQNARGLGEIGVDLERLAPGRWSLTAVPEACRNNLASVINTATAHPLPEEELERSFYAQIACKAAIKDGDSVDEVTARSLLEEVFALDNARCPHGRPIWHELTKERLFELVGRT